MGSLVDQYGPFVRVEEAARLLRVSRTSAYALARQWLDCDGVEALPAVRIGRSVRISTAVLEQLAAGREPAADPASSAARRQLSSLMTMTALGLPDVNYRQVPAVLAGVG